MHQNAFGGQAPPGPAGELKRSPYPLAVNRGRGRVRKGEGGKGKRGKGKGREGKGKEGKGKEGEGEGKGRDVPPTLEVDRRHWQI